MNGKPPLSTNCSWSRFTQSLIYETIFNAVSRLISAFQYSKNKGVGECTINLRSNRFKHAVHDVFVYIIQ